MTPGLVVVSGFFGRDEATCFERIGRACAEARPGSVLVQLREHELSAKKRLELGRRLVALAHAQGQLFGVNDRLDLALMLGADAVHLGEPSVEPSDARALVGPSVQLFRACHEPAAASANGADAVVLSPIIAPRHGRPALGLEALGKARDVLGRDRLLFALGGVDRANAAEVLGAGADGVAVMGAVLDQDDALALLEALGIRRR